MIVTITKGKSLGGLGAYLLHDKAEAGGPQPTTSVRVAWTHAHNLSETTPEAALQEMIHTAQPATQARLKALAGERADGRPIKNSALHVVLSWHPTEQPGQAHMIAAAESYLESMGWRDTAQVLMVAHNDTPHPQLHLEISRINPANGRAIDDAWVKKRSQAWALGYEQGQGRVFCHERQKRAEGQPARDLHMPRWQYEQWKATGLSREAFLDGIAAREQQRADLKEGQKAERLRFVADTKAGAKGLRGEVWTAVQREFAPRWQAYARRREQMAAERQGASQSLKVKLRLAGYRDWAQQLRRAERSHAADLRAELKELRGAIQRDQSDRFAQINDDAFERYGAGRMAVYQELLARQKAERHQERAGQAVPPAPPQAATAAELAAARARAIADAQRAPHVAPTPKPADHARAGAPPLVAAEQGRKAMLDEEQRRKKPTAQAQPFTFGRLVETVFGFNPLKPVPPMPSEQPAREQGQREHEQQTRAVESAQIAKGERRHPLDRERADWPRLQAEQRDQQRAREAAAQPYRGGAPGPFVVEPTGPIYRGWPRPQEPKAPQPPTPLPSTENRPANWHGGTPQHGFGFTAGQAPSPHHPATPTVRQHPAPQIEKTPEEQWRAFQAEARQARQEAEEHRYKARAAFTTGREQITGLSNDREAQRQGDGRRAWDRDVFRREGQELTAADPNRAVDPRRADARLRYGAGKEVTDRMAERAGRQPETTDRQRVVSDKAQRREAFLKEWDAERVHTHTNDREPGRDR